MRQVICLGRGPQIIWEKSAELEGTTVKTIPLSWIIVPALTFILLAPARAGETQQLTGHVPAAIAKLNLQPLGVPPSTNRLHLAIGLPLCCNHAPNSDALLEQIGDPTSPNFRHYLSTEQFIDRFGPTEKDYEALVSFASAHGFTVSARHSNRALLSVTASVADIENAFHVKMRMYHHPTEARTFYAPDTEPTVPAELSILGISGLSDYSKPKPRLQVSPVNQSQAQPSSGSGPSGLYMGGDFRAAYAP